MPDLVLLAGVLSATITGSQVSGPNWLPDDTCPPSAFRVADALMTADTLGVGVSAASRDSSGIDTLTTKPGFPHDVSFVQLTYRITCVFATPDSVILRITSRYAGWIAPLEDHEGVARDTGTTVHYWDVVKREDRWKVKGSFSALDLSPAAALRRFGGALDQRSRKALAQLIEGRR